MSTYPAPDFERKILSPAELAAKLDSLPRPLVFTNGCFDILHRGHASYLAQARALGACMVLALNTDASVRRQGKGDDRPINPLENRAAVAAALESVDYVTWFDDDTPAALIEQLCPDVLVKGGDWQPENIVGAAQTLLRGQCDGARRQRPLHPLSAPDLHYQNAGKNPRIGKRIGQPETFV